jgi:hypothetical protein
MKLISISNSNRVKPSLPVNINIKGHGRLRTSNPIESTKSIYFYRFYLSSSLPFFSNPDMLFFLRLLCVWGHSSWHTEPKATQGAPAPTGSLPSGRLLDSRWAAPTRPVWPVHHTYLTGWCCGAARNITACCMCKCYRRGQAYDISRVFNWIPIICVKKNYICSVL